ncbi:MAG TPA: UDP-N-acetylmuramate dehydrogenase [Alphaproteobacteria bacterium]|nr:UDP-N-acetylmuramate dehydrogenase [Alphaproteobacteria bacterium]
MMAAERIPRQLLDRLPRARGRLRTEAALAPQAWFRVGGPAEILFRPADPDDLAGFLAACPADIPVTAIGVASNLLIRDGGIPGVVVRLGGEFARTRIDGANVIAGAGALDVTVAHEAQAAGLGGLEFLSGIPGTIGGAVKMNAGAYGREIVDVVERATIVTRDGRVATLDRDALGLVYRGSALPDGAIVIDATLRAKREDADEIARRMEEIGERRAASQPVRARTGGSTFANPPGVKAWELIDKAGCRGLTMGGAQVSEQHCNFLINTGSASAADLEALGEEVRRRVRESSGIDLQWEIKRIGMPQ